MKKIIEFLRRHSILWIILLGCIHFNAFAQETLKVTGRVIPPHGYQIPQEELTVVLLKYRLNQQGNLQPLGPLARTQTQTSGQFSFDIVPLDSNAAYQIGSRFQGNLVSSNYFFMKPGEAVIQVNLVIPGISEDVDQLSVPRVAIIVELGVGSIQVTEVLNIDNATQNTIDTSKNPLVFKIPSSFTDFNMMGDSADSGKSFELLGQELHYFHQFPPGTSTIAFRYQFNVPFGQMTLMKEFTKPFQTGRVLIPVGLTLESDQLKIGPIETLGEAQFQAYQINDLKQASLTLDFSGIPVQHINYIYFGVALVFVLILLAFAYIRWKIPNLK